MKRVLLLNDGKAGHFNQTLAVSFAIDTCYRPQTETAGIKVRRLGKYLLRWMLNHSFGKKILEHPMLRSCIHCFYHIDIPLHSYDIIISSGKDTSLLNAWLGLLYGSHTIYIGNPKKLNPLLFNTVLTVLEHGFENEIVLDVAPTLPFQGEIDDFCQKMHLNKSAKYVTLLIGGDGSGYLYDEKDYDRLTAFVNRTAKEVNWLVTTSRRTPVEIEKKMQREMKAAKFIAYHQNPQKVVAGFLTLSETVYVTEESASMVGEAIAAQKKVITLYPRYRKGDKDYQKILSKYRKNHRIVSWSMEEMQDFNMQKVDITPSDSNSIDEMIMKLKERLNSETDCNSCN